MNTEYYVGDEEQSNFWEHVNPATTPLQEIPARFWLNRPQMDNIARDIPVTPPQQRRANNTSCEISTTLPWGSMADGDNEDCYIDSESQCGSYHLATFPLTCHQIKFPPKLMRAGHVVPPHYQETRIGATYLADK